MKRAIISLVAALMVIAFLGAITLIVIVGGSGLGYAGIVLTPLAAFIVGGSVWNALEDTPRTPPTPEIPSHKRPRSVSPVQTAPRVKNSW